MISERTILQVRQRTDLRELIAESVKLVRRGRSWVGLCPFHKEKSPSFHVTPERGIYHCFGCGEHGNVVTFMMKVEGLSFPEAVRRLAERAGIDVEETASPEQRREEIAARKAKDDLYAVNGVAAHYFETMLHEHASCRVAREELEKRGLVVAQPTDLVATTLAAFRVGYAPAGWDGLAQYLKAQGVSPKAAEQVGLVVPRSSGGGHYDRFRNRLMFAVLDLQGRVVAFSGRILPDPQTGLVEKEAGKYINSPETPIYRKGETVFGLFQARQAIRQQQEAIVVEGNFDVVSLHARGIGNAVAPLGTAFTGEQATHIKRFAPAVTLLFDADDAGRKAVRAAREVCKKAGLEAKATMVHVGKDPDEFVRLKGADALLALVKSAKSVVEHLVESALEAPLERGDALEKAAKAREVAEIINLEEDPIVRSMLAKRYAEELAGRLQVADSFLGQADPATFRMLVRSVEAAASRPQVAVKKGETAARDAQVDELLGCLLDFPALLDEPKVQDGLNWLDGDAVFVVAALRRWGEEQGVASSDPDEFLAKLPASFHSFALTRLAAPVHQDMDTARTQLLANAAKLKARALSRENAMMRLESAKAAASGDDEAAFALLRDMQARAQQKLGLRRGRS